jgi:FixJ family two-component response regulator
VCHPKRKVPQNAKPIATPLVCIVDDDASIADSTRYLVGAFGFKAVAFTSAREFLGSSLVEETRCLILDVRMPGMDGLELQRYLANVDKRIPIVFITAQATDNERRQALAGGAVDLLLKPFSEDALFAAIQAALNR